MKLSREAKIRKQKFENEPRIHNCFVNEYPELLLEWDWELNTENPYKLSSCSKIKVYWVCQNKQVPCREECHRWFNSLKNRTIKKTVKGTPTGCPFCKSGKVCKHNNLTITHPKIAGEWDKEKNEKGPENYSYGSGTKVYWIFTNPGVCKCHKWQARISHRTDKINPSGCPFCEKNKVCKHNNLTTTNPELIKEWDKSNEKGPENYSMGSHKIIKWKCRKCHYKWKTQIKYRTRKGEPAGCPKCAKQRYSEICLKWLTYMENTIIKNKIQHAGNDGEKVIFVENKRYLLDGYCEKYYIAFEFHGCFWHGCPKCYKRDEINPMNKKTMGELYDKTMEKQKALINSGKVFLFYIWAHYVAPCKWKLPKGQLPLDGNVNTTKL